MTLLSHFPIIVQKKFVSIQFNFRSAPKVLCFKNLGSHGWLPGAPGGFMRFLKHNTFGAYTDE